MASIFTDTAAGYILRAVTKSKILRYPEEKEGFTLPETWLRLLEEDKTLNPSIYIPGKTTMTANNDGNQGIPTPDSAVSSSSSINGVLEGDEEAEEEKKKRRSLDSDDEKMSTREAEVEEAGLPAAAALHRTNTRGEGPSSARALADRLEADRIHALEKTQSIPIVPRRTKDGAILVDWYYTDDPANPKNWSNLRRASVTLLICVYTWVVYMSSAIYTTSEHGVMAEFGVNGTQASLGLALYVLGYGVGPLIFSPLSELPVIGRNPIYIVTMFLYVIVSIPAAMPQNFAGLMFLRFLQGFFGSPCLAAGGASIGDLYSMLSLPYAMMAWVSSAYCGPSLGPLLSGFSVPVMGWRWSLLEILWAASPIFLAMFAFLPETAGPTILLRRAERLRRLTGSERFMSQSELDQRGQRFSAVLLDALIKPIEITAKDPAILFVQIYTAIIYGIYYSFFEVFPLVYPVHYHMGPGQIGLVFICILIADAIGVAIYGSYLYFYMNPRIVARGDPVHESRLVPALPAAFGPTMGLFLFAWTATPAFHWAVPTVGITIYGAAAFVVMQCIFIYVPLSYPKYAASLFAANDFFRSAIAFSSVLFAKPMFAALGVSRGTSLLGGLSTIGIIGIFALWIYGGRLRAMSKFAESEKE